MEVKQLAKLYRPWQVRVFVATWLAYAGYYFCRKAFFIVKADLAQEIGIGTRDLAHLGTAYLAAYMVGQFSSAYFGRRLGAKLLLLAGMGISLSCNVVFGFSNGFWTVFAFLVLNGLVQGTGWPGSIGALAFWFRRKERGQVLGLWATCYQVGSVAASSFAAFMLAYGGWRYSFFGAAAVLSVVWLFVLFVQPRTPKHHKLPPLEEEETKDEGEEGAKEEPKSGLGWSRQVWTSILLMGAIYFCIKFLRYALWSWAPFFLQENFGLAGDDAGYVSTVFDVFGFIGVVAAGFVSDRLFKGRRATVAFVMIFFMTISFGVMAMIGSQSVLAFTICMGFAGFMLFGPDSLISGTGAIDVGSKKGALVAAGIINGMGSIGPIVQEELIGWMYEAYEGDLSPVLFVLLGISVLCTLIMGALWWRARQGKSRL